MRYSVGFALALLVSRTCLATVSQTVDYVIHISVDGLRPDAVTTLGASEVPNFYRLRAEGAFTDNARTDPDVTVTMANHVCMLTGRGQLGSDGHNVTRNSDPGGAAGRLGSVGISTNSGEFVRGTGALRIDAGGGANHVAVNGSLITAPTNANTITVAAWFKFEDLGGDGSDARNFLWETAPGAYPLSFGVRSDTADVQKHTQWYTQSPAVGGDAENLPAVGDGLWHHAVVVIDEGADTLEYYFDGELVDSVSIPGLVLEQAGAERFNIGSHRAGNGSRNWDGFIDDMAVFDHGVASNQVAALYAGTLDVMSVTGGNVVAYWPFDADYSSETNNHLYQGSVVSGTVVTVHSDCAAAGGDAYVESVFDVVHDHGLDTGFYAGWNGFNYLNVSWNADNGAPDIAGGDDGTDKIDTYVLVTDDDLAAQTTTFLANMAAAPHNYSLLHWHRTDAVGHGYQWMSAEYLQAVKETDAQLGRVLEFVETNAVLQGKTVVILTADHGGHGYGHSAAYIECHTIPLYVWGPGVVGGDLYQMNWDTRADPGRARPDYTPAPQPIRNGDVANLALELLGLPAVTGSSINAYQDLRLTEPPDAPQPDASAVRAARVQVTGTDNASTAYAVLNETPRFNVSFANNNFGDHELYSDGVRLLQTDGVIMACGNDGGDSIAQVAGDLTYKGGADPRYDNGMGFSAADLSGNGEKNFDFSFAHFPFDMGWIAAHVDTDGTILAGPNLPPGTTVTNLSTAPSWRGAGHYGVHIPGVDARTNGLLFVVGGENDNNVTVAGVFEDSDDVNVVAGEAALGDWHVQIRDASHNDTSNVGETGTFSFLYLPGDTLNLVGGRIQGNGAVLRSVGTFSGSDGASTGQVKIQIPDGQGGFVSDQDGVLILTCSGVIDNINSGNNQDPVDGNVLSWTYDGTDQLFVVHAFDAPTGNAQDVRDFVFAFIPYDGSLRLPSPSSSGTLIIVR